jgi:uncharacterized damage-inducible protein DinB
MNLSNQIAKHLREIHFGGNWTSVNLKATLENVNWEIATKKINSFHSIASLVFHINYYVSEVLKVLQGEMLTASDKFSFATPAINNQQDWENLLQKVWLDAENFAVLLEQLPVEKLWQNFTDEKYGNYYRNMHGIIEHSHYHLGQIVFLKKILMPIAVES